MTSDPDNVADSVLIEARARITWGEADREVIKYLMSQGIPYPEAAALVADLINERHRALRQRAFWKVLGGAGLILIPVVLGLTEWKARRLGVRTFGLSVAGGLYGVWLVVNGIITLVVPKSDSGDLSDG